jgi:hypothetical protein
MAYIFSTNVVSALYDGAADYFALKEMLKAAGWTVIATGDGLGLYGAGSDVLASAGGGAGGMANARAYWTLQQPAGGAAPYAGSRQLTWQTGSGFGLAANRYDARVVWSEGGTANLGAASYDTVPAFSDERILMGGGTPAAPTYAAWQQGAGSRSIMVGGVAENFSILMLSWVSGNPPGSVFFVDGLKRIVPGDLHPFVVHCRNTTPSQANFNNFAAVFAKFNGDPLHYHTKMHGNTYDGGQLKENAVDGKVTPIDAYYGRSNAETGPGGYKGVSSIWQFTGGTRTFRERGTETTAGDRVTVSSDLQTFWNGPAVV